MYANVIVHTKLPPSLAILWTEPVASKPKWLPLNFGCHDIMRMGGGGGIFYLLKNRKGWGRILMLNNWVSARHPFELVNVLEKWHIAATISLSFLCILHIASRARTTWISTNPLRRLPRKCKHIPTCQWRLNYSLTPPTCEGGCQGCVIYFHIRWSVFDEKLINEKENPWNY